MCLIKQGIITGQALSKVWDFISSLKEIIELQPFGIASHQAAHVNKLPFSRPFAEKGFFRFLSSIFWKSWFKSSIRPCPKYQNMRKINRRWPKSAIPDFGQVLFTDSPKIVICPQNPFAGIESCPQLETFFGLAASGSSEKHFQLLGSTRPANVLFVNLYGEVHWRRD